MLKSDQCARIGLQVAKQPFSNVAVIVVVVAVCHASSNNSLTKLNPYQAYGRSGMALWLIGGEREPFWA